MTWDEIADCDPADFTLTTMPGRFAAIGDRHADIDQHPCSLEALLELAARHEREGLGDAPWPPQYKKQPGEAPRVQPSRARSPLTRDRGGTRRAPGSQSRASATGRRVPKYPLIEIARADRKDDALAELERWKATHADVAAHLAPADILVDAMRGRSSTWTRVRVNLKNVPEALRTPLVARARSGQP
jgi:hypothetical protein